jgi:uncharacterized protein YjiS (DUF1127 family)
MLLRMIRALSHRVFPKLRRYTCFSTISRQRQQEAQLRAMNDLELKDLGIGASEIPALLQGDVPQRAAAGWGNRHPV